ncbi:MAG TPA: AMP-binding protein [Acidimicrobiales bacterium]
MEAHYATVWEAVADAVPHEDAIVQGSVRRSWGDFEDRAARLATAFVEAGVGKDGKVALYLYNSPEYLEAYFAAFKLRGIPVNVNYRYLDDELHYLLDNSDSEVVVFHSSLADRVSRVRDRLPHVKRWIEVADDGSHAGGAERYEEVVAGCAPAPRIERSPHDIGMTYTGGTTGMPKGVMSEIGGGVTVQLATLPPLLGLPAKTSEDVPALAKELVEVGKRPSTIVACPLMHGTGIGIGAAPTLTCAGTVYLLENRKFDPHEVWDLAEREGVFGVVVVGDPFARPLVRALDERPGRDLSRMVLVSSAGAMFSREVKQRLVEHMPQLLIIDFMAATEGSMGQSVFTRNTTADTARFRLNPSVKVLTDDDREVAPGSGEVGMVAVPDTGTLGYYKDAEKTARTFREIDGVRWTFPGDFATVEEDGSITLLGRGSQVINTGGEKVFAEEVEEVLKTHPSIDDCLVVGVPDERFGHRVVAVVSSVGGGAGGVGEVDETDVIAHAKGKLAAFKAPKEVVVVATVPRAPNGKADYKAARELAAGLR